MTFEAQNGLFLIHYMQAEQILFARRSLPLALVCAIMLTQVGKQRHQE